MYFILDNDRLCVTHKHSDVFSLCEVALIEQPDGNYEIWSFDDVRHLYTRTETELALLYTNLTGQAPKRTGNQLRKLILEAAHRLPESQISYAEASKQADWATNNPRADGFYHYAEGSSRPQLFGRPAPHLFTTPAESDDAVLATWAPPAATPGPANMPASLREAVATGGRAGRVAGVAPTTPRQGGVRQLIWDRADAMWEAAGKPTDKKEVLALRKSVMDALELEGVKRTSSSNELGNWQKARIVG